MKKYRTIVADPPWDYRRFGGFNRSIGKWSREVVKPLPYPSLSVDQIAALPIADLAASDAHLWLWTTNRYLPAAFGVASAWGFEYRQTVVWHKPGFGPLGGAIAPNRAEFLLFCRRGSLPMIGKATSNVVTIPLGASTHRQHSQKPDAFLDMVETISPEPRLELFARRQRLGWDTWGDQALDHVEMATRQ